ncbi:MAG: carbamoyl-phosphate synthase (glutamine-hydrolyzing) large subunit, partial [archaeon]
MTNLYGKKKEKKIEKVLVLGSGAIKIGEAGEFDFSGSQALKALKEDGIKSVLVNPNIATIQTDPKMADRVYLLPVNADYVERIIAKERPDGILLNVGGQTALNCGVELHNKGILSRYDVKVLGTQVDAIETTENRDLFRIAMNKEGIKICKSKAVMNKADALKFAKEIGFPCMVRAAFTLGGEGSGIAWDEKELERIVDTGTARSAIRQVLVEEYVGGWKEIEYEVMRDVDDNCIIICNMENFDPVGIHTGESIVVAPSQTLNNHEYHMLRELAIRIIRALGIVGECNIQYALDPDSDEYRVIEVNPRLSRSSALASKATGYPMAFIATKLCLGGKLPDIVNKLTGVTTACFEPALDYIVVKVPRWDLKKFKNADYRIGTQMKSVGEVMAIGRKFEEALQKALRMTDTGRSGLVGTGERNKDVIRKMLKTATDERVYHIADAIKCGMSIDEIHEYTKIDRWFLSKMLNIVDYEDVIAKSLDENVLRHAKQLGFSDKHIAEIVSLGEDDIRNMRKKWAVIPCVKQIDTLAAEWPAKTNYLYLTYNGWEDDVSSTSGDVIILGSGTYRIGSSVEFDWCSVHGAWAVANRGRRTIMINYNPETVSTDYDIVDKLYFEDLSFETVMDIYEKEDPLGVIVSFGGQRPNNIALRLYKEGVRILGTNPMNIDRAEDRAKFSALLDKIGIEQPYWKKFGTIADATKFAEKIGYPVIIRPSYVLSGAAMSIVYSEDDLEKYLSIAAKVSREHPVVISRFMDNAREVEVDGVCDGSNVLIGAIMEHIENAGVHSGDATMVIPPQTLSDSVKKKIEKASFEIATGLNIHGPFNIQFIVKNEKIFVIECNLRVSRSVPFVSKTMGINLIDIATGVILGQKLLYTATPKIKHIGIKFPQFSFSRLYGADPIVGIEMSSTGEVACLGRDFSHTLINAMISAQVKVPVRGSRVLLCLSDDARVKLFDSVKMLEEMGVRLFATFGTAQYLLEKGIHVIPLHKVSEEKEPNIETMLAKRDIDFVINIPHKRAKKVEISDGYVIRRSALNFGIPLVTNLELANAMIGAMKGMNETKDVVSLAEFHG